MIHTDALWKKNRNAPIKSVDTYELKWFGINIVKHSFSKIGFINNYIAFKSYVNIFMKFINKVIKFISEHLHH